MAPLVEPRVLGRTRRRPDIIVHSATETVLVDVSLLHPLSPSYVATNHADDARREQRIIQQRELRKRNKYDGMAKQYDGGRVAPFVVDAYGAFGQGAEEFVRWVAAAAVANGCVERDADFRSLAFGRIAVAVQRGNVELLDSALVRVRQARRA